MHIRIATTISYLMHPLLMPLLLLILVFNSDSYIQLATPVKLQHIIYALVIVTTLLIPTTFSYLLLKNGIIKSLQMETKEERRIPYLITGIFYFLTFYLLRLVSIAPLISILFLAATFTLLLTMLINIKWKISAHMVGIGGLLGALIGISLRLNLDFRFLIVLFLFLSGIIGTSRMLLKAHSPAQVYIGFMVGLFAQLFIFSLV